MKSNLTSTITLFTATWCLAAVAMTAELPLSKLDISRMESGFGQSSAGKSVDGNPLKIGGKSYADGVGTHAESSLSLVLDGKAGFLTAEVGVDAEVGANGSVEFVVTADGREVFRSGIMKGGQAARPLKVPLAGVRRLDLQVLDGDDGIDFDHADWADARITFTGAAPVVAVPEKEEAVILTPKPGPQPRLTGPRVFGARPGNPFLHRITATGEKPVTFTADGLPPGIRLDARTGLLTGSLATKGEWKVKVSATNTRGSASRTLKIIGGDAIALTPPMGWNSWNCFASAVTDKNIRDAARVMAESSLIDHGWTYINIDDYWQVKPGDSDPTLQGAERDADGKILPNKRFPDMKNLTDYIHSLGLKAGIYSSPGPLTCGGCSGSFGHEHQDAATYAAWGFDYLKHDWCSYEPHMEGKRAAAVPHVPAIDAITDDELLKLMIPYAIMRDALNRQKRDIYYSLCQYGMGNVSEWGAQVGGNSWRTTGDITDTWASMAGIGFEQNGLEKHARPGQWNDPDMLVVGHVGWGPALHPTKLTPNEQYTHISLWCLLASPLLIGCDLTKLDEFTLNLLTNDEVLEVNQDELGKQAGRISKNGNAEVWAKRMVDGSWAVGLFNRGISPLPVTVDLSTIGITGKARVRDLWRQKDLSPAEKTITQTIPRHGCSLLRIAGIDATAPAPPAPRTKISNQLPRLDAAGKIVDAHDGCLHKFGDRYYLYGTAYGNTDGFNMNNRYRCYSSADLVTWKFEGELLKDPPDGVYYRPYVVRNPRTGKYVLWYNWYATLWDGQYGVATSDTPQGPFVIQNGNVKVAREKPGDHNLMVDDDGTAYLIYTSIASGHAISIEKLTPDYLGSTRESSGVLANGSEACSLFKRGNLYYAVFDACCCFCPEGSGAQVWVAEKPLGPYKQRGNINRDPTGRPIIAAQQTFVAQLPTRRGAAYIWMGDRWGSTPDGVKGHDFQYWSAPLEFTNDGSILPLQWDPLVELELE